MPSKDNWVFWKRYSNYVGESHFENKPNDIEGKANRESNNEIVYRTEILYDIIQFVYIVTSSLNLIDQILTGCAAIILHTASIQVKIMNKDIINFYCLMNRCTTHMQCEFPYENVEYHKTFSTMS